MNLPSLRKQIDRVDRRVLRLLNDRAKLALRVGRLKKTQKLPVFDGRREQVVLRELARANRGPLPTRAIRTIFSAILRASRTLELKKRSR